MKSLQKLTRIKRGTSLEELRPLVKQCMSENKRDTLRCAMYIRDKRGLGERQLFRDIINIILEDCNLTETIAIIYSIPKFGRWDDVVYLYEKGSTETARTFCLKLIKGQLFMDMSSQKEPSTLAKWMPSENTSSKVTRKLARKLIHDLSMTPKSYRQVIVGLRKRLYIVEREMSSGNWEKLEYSKLSPDLMGRYKRAFKKHDGKRFKFYEDEMKKTKRKPLSLSSSRYVVKIPSKEAQTIYETW